MANSEYPDDRRCRLCKHYKNYAICEDCYRYQEDTNDYYELKEIRKTK